MRGAVRPSNALEKVPPHVHEVLTRLDLHIERHSSQLEGEPLIRPYWDTTLDPSTARGRVRLLALLRKLADMGIVIGVKRKKADAALDRLFTWVIGNGGVISGEHGIGLAKKPWIRQALGDTSMQIHHSIKQALDPKNILNPGKFLD